MLSDNQTLRTRVGAGFAISGPGPRESGRVPPTILWMLPLLMILPFSMFAQELRGTVTMSDRITPAGGVVVIMLHETRDDSIVARTVTSERGRFSLKPPAAMPTRVRLLRIGFQPMELGRFTLAASETRDTAIVVSDVRVHLATFDVRANSRCEVRPDGARLVAQLFDAARTALISTTASVTGLTSRSEYVSFERLQDRRGQALSPVRRTPGSGATLKAFGRAMTVSV